MAFFGKFVRLGINRYYIQKTNKWDRCTKYCIWRRLFWVLNLHHLIFLQFWESFLVSNHTLESFWNIPGLYTLYNHTVCTRCHLLILMKPTNEIFLLFLVKYQFSLISYGGLCPIVRLREKGPAVRSGCCTVRLLYGQAAVRSGCCTVRLLYGQAAVRSGCCTVRLLYGQAAVRSGCCTVRLLYGQAAVRSGCCTVRLLYGQAAVRSGCCTVRLLYGQAAVRSGCCTVRLLYGQAAVRSGCCTVRLLYGQAAVRSGCCTVRLLLFLTYFTKKQVYQKTKKIMLNSSIIWITFQKEVSKFL